MSTLPPPSDADPIDWELLLRHAAGDATLAEATQVERWLAARPDRRRIQTALVAAFDVDTESPPPSDSAAVWRAINERLETPRLASGSARTHAATLPALWPRGVGAGGNATWRRPVIATALVVGVGLSVAVGVMRHGVGSEGTAPAGRDYATAAGQRLRVTLPDGTHITLAPASHLRVPLTYGRARRDVQLDGEGYFAVIHDAARPFTVHAANAIATDVGTQFDVRAYAGDRALRLAVTEGRVSLAAPAARAMPQPARVPSAQPTVLGAGDLATVAADGTLRVAHDADVATSTAWTSGTLVLADTPLADAAVELSRWYGVDVRVRDATIARRHISVTLTQPSVVTALEIIAPTVGARVQHTDAAYVLYPSLTPARTDP